MPTPEDRTAYAILFLALFVPFTYFNHSSGWNQTARLAQLHAAVVRRSVAIDAYHELTGDKALVEGHYYSEKAPAIVAIALPAFAVTVWIQQLAGIDPDGPTGWRVSEWIATAASVGVLAALGGVAFFALVEARLGPLTAMLSTSGIFLGSLTFPYATALFAHAGTIGLLAIALWGALGSGESRRDYLAGFAAGLAVASEYPAVISCAVIGLYLAWIDRGRMWRFVIATLPAAALILLNNYLMTGSPLKLTYGSNPAFPEMTTGNLMGFRMPDLGLAPALLWGEYRGLFFWSPILLMVLPGFVQLFRRDRAAAVLVTCGSVLVFLQVAAFYNWFGGNAVGLRYYAPGLPFLALAVAYGINRFPAMGLVLTIVSIALMGMVTAIALDPPGESMTPLQSFYLVRIEQHRFADNLGTLIGLPLWLSLLVPLLFPAVAAWRIWVRRSRPQNLVEGRSRDAA